MILLDMVVALRIGLSRDDKHLDGAITHILIGRSLDTADTTGGKYGNDAGRQSHGDILAESNSP